MDLISNIFKTSVFKHDRFFNESFSLPYDIDSIKIQPNELNTYRAVNASIEKLYTNFLYIYSLTKMGNNIVPDSLANVAGVLNDTETFQWTTSSTSIASLTTFSSIGLSGFDNAVYNKVEYSPSLGQNIIVTASPTEIILTKATRNDTTITVLLSSDSIDSSQNLKFKNITGIALVDTQLFVCDSFYNSIYKYDLNLLYNDVIYPKSLVLTKVIGGVGEARDRYKFNNIKSLDVINDKVYVVDRDNLCIKVYDLDLNFINYIQRRDLFIDNKPTVISGEPKTNKIFIATDNNTVFVFDDNIKEYTTVRFGLFVVPGEVIKSFSFSNNFNNVYYVCTNKNVWKFYLSKPSNPIGKFTLYRFGVPNSNTVIDTDSVASSVSGVDDVYLLSRSISGVNSFIKLKDSENYSDVLTIPDFDVYTLDEIKLQRSEYSQTWVFNKAIQKLVLNHIRLKDKIIGRFFGDFDDQNNLLLAGFLYFLLDDLDLTGYKITKDHFAGNNEAFLNTVVSRGFEKLYELQELILSKSNTIILDSSFSETEAVLLD